MLAGGSIGYEIFNRSKSLGTSNFVLNILHLRALEGELARTIRSLSHVRRTRVHLVLPSRQLFSRDVPEPSGSVVLAMQGGRRLTSSKVYAIAQLVAAAVPNLQPSHISIIYGQGTLLTKGHGEIGRVGNSTDTASRDSTRKAYENEMSRTIEELLERSVGASRIRAEVTAEMDFDRLSTTTETYDPDRQVVRSTQSVEEIAAVGTAGNLPTALNNAEVGTLIKALFAAQNARSLTTPKRATLFCKPISS